MDAHYAAHDRTTVGTRLRELRTWRGLSLRACAELSGLSYSYLGKIERNEKPLSNRFQLDALARTLRVSPVELAGYPYSGDDGSVSEAHRALNPMRAITASLELGDSPTVDQPRPLPTLLGEAAYTSRARVACRHGEVGDLVGPLIRELHAHTHTASGDDLRSAYAAMAELYEAIRAAAKHNGAGELAQLAASRVQALADRLAAPEWYGLAMWSRVQALGSADRATGLRLATTAAAELDGSEGAALEMHGMNHLNAAITAASLADYDTAGEHLDAAENAASHAPGANFGYLSFGPTNVQLWKIAVAVERGDAGSAVEIGGTVQPSALPTPERQAAYWQDYGQGLAMANKRGSAIQAFSHAERLAPARTRLNPLVRESVTDLLRSIRRDAEGRELRGLAHRMAITPSG